MCQIIMFAGRVRSGPREEGPDDAIAVLEDGVHPGRKVVSGRDWDSDPIAPWRIIDVPGVPAATFAHLTEVELDVDQSTVKTLRLRRVDLLALPARATAELNTRGRTAVTAPEVSTANNPRGL